MPEVSSNEGQTEWEHPNRAPDAPAENTRRRGMDESWLEGKHVDVRDRLRPVLKTGFVPCRIGTAVYEFGWEVFSQTNVPVQRQLHTWKTRKDPLAEIRPKAQEMLQDAPELKSKALFEHLIAGDADAAGEKHLRIFQRRLREWRLANGPGKEVFFSQTDSSLGYHS